MFERFGVPAAGETLYLELVQRASASVAEVAAALGLTSEEVGARLEELARHGLVDPDPGSPLGYRVTPPHRAVEVLIGREEERLAREREALQASRGDVGGLLADFVAARVREGEERVETIDEASVVRARLYQLVKRARTSVWATHVGPALSPEATADSLALDEDLAARGIELRQLVSRESLGPAHWTDYLDRTAALGHRVRVMGAIPLLQIVVDQQVVLVPFRSESGSTGAKVLHGESIARPAVVLFEELWGAGTPYEHSAAVGEDSGIDEDRMRQVAQLLAAGLKDETIARRLGVSTRTVRRVVSAMLDHLGADSRFQAAVLAAELGWLEVRTAPGRPPSR